jgi:hypothetical protein
VSNSYISTEDIKSALNQFSSQPSPSSKIGFEKEFNTISSILEDEKRRIGFLSCNQEMVSLKILRSDLMLISENHLDSD